MRTEDLIRALAEDTRTARPVWHAAVLGLCLALAVGVVGVWAVLGFRPGLGAALSVPISAARLMLTLGLLAAALPAALALARPEARPRLWPIALPLALAAALWTAAYVATPPEGVGMAVTGKTMVTCLTAIPVLALLPVTAVLASLRRGAVTRPALAGALTGLAGGGGAAAAYALHCTEDSPLFYVTWYGLAILIVTAVSALAGARLLRW